VALQEDKQEEREKIKTREVNEKGKKEKKKKYSFVLSRNYIVGRSLVLGPQHHWCNEMK
jgi:hypothetical protein